MTYSSQNQATVVLNNHGVIAHQTDTVIGLACLPTEKLLTRLIRIKQRHHQKSFILLASSLDQLNDFIQVDTNGLCLLNTVRQQPTSWLVPAKSKVPPQLLGNTNKIAVRITNHPGIKSICDYVGAIASTSANISDQPICMDLQQARKIFGPNIDYIDQNQTLGTGKSSTIVDLNSGNILRE
jgi:tRNA threonylcarbamoyl adenosine modification protein (Sua5/YciO/YrdC/YwlC family)